MDDLNIIDTFTQTFVTYIDSGFGILSPDVSFLTSTLVAIDIILAGLFWSLSHEDNVVAQLIRKILYVGFFAFLLNNFASLSSVIFNSFASLGLKASGSTLTATDLMRPGFVAGTGFTASQPLLDQAGSLMGFTSFFDNVVTITVLLLAWIIVLLAFFILSVQLFITILEFKLTTLAGFILVPFALFGKTSFLAERVLGNVMTSGIKLMVLAIVVGIGSTLFGTLTAAPTGDITLEQAAAHILAAIAVFGLAIFAPGIAAGLISGAPQLGAGAAVGTAAGLAAAGVAGAAGAGLLARGAAAGAGRAVTSAASLSGAAQAGFKAGGVGGALNATVGQPLKDAASKASAPMRDAYREGSAYGLKAAGGSAAASGAGSSGRGSSPSSAEPDWARRLRRREQMTRAGTVASQSIREGDRGSASEGPDLNPDS
ncbi:MAG: P-type conjugative transfer protein TrbL [Rhizobiales bacterium]|nr:P-type conjugative transfer protein TrbL [Hyphomicrobiales bacterium]